MRKLFVSYRVALETLVIVAALVGLRWMLWSIGLEGISTSPLTSSIVAGGVFVMGLVVAGTLSDYRDAERAPTDLAAGLYAILREAESFDKVWGKPDMPRLRERLVAVVTTLRSDINAGNTRDRQLAVEDLSESLQELEDSDVPANYIVRLRSEQAGLRKSLLRVYHIQREQFLPSAKAMITTIVVVILLMLLVTNMGGLTESLITLGFLSFLFLYLLRLLNVIDTPFKVGQERTDDDVSLFLLTEFMVHAQAAGADAVPPRTSKPRPPRSRSSWSRTRRPRPPSWKRQRRPRRRQQSPNPRRHGTRAADPLPRTSPTCARVAGRRGAASR